MIYICQEHWNVNRFAKCYIFFITITEFLIPLSLMGFIYFSIAQRLWFHRILPGNQTDQNREISLIRKRKTIPTLITVVVAFFICWAPYYSYNLALQFDWSGIGDSQHLMSIYFVVESIATLNSVISTIIYLFMSPIFRAELYNLVNSVAYGQRFEAGLKQSQRGRYHIPSRTGSNISHTKNGSLNVVRKSSHETGEARLWKYERNWMSLQSTVKPEGLRPTFLRAWNLKSDKVLVFYRSKFSNRLNRFSCP